MVEAHPDKYRALLIKTLSGITREAVASTAVRTVKMRDEWPFLSEDDCPIELKILAADKITAWKNYVTNHQKLFSVCSLEECLETAKNCVFFYCQNRKIFSEFAHYKEHKAILGKHPIFQELDRLKNYRGMDVLSLSSGTRRIFCKRFGDLSAGWGKVTARILTNRAGSCWAPRKGSSPRSVV